jgi:Protein of unknown function (DUF3060)
MSDYLSPDQEDPEKRIRELERGLADTSHPPTQQPTQFPNYGYNPASGSTPAWSPPPAQPRSQSLPGYQSTPFFRPERRTRRGSPRLWLGLVIAIAFISPAIGAIPWGKLNLFGPTKVPQGGSLTVNDSNASKTVECNDGHLGINGNNLTITVTGHCASLDVNGTNHHITVDKADSIDANGIDNVIIYHSGEPKISKNGIDVTIKHG